MTGEDRSMKISPQYAVKDWKALTFSTEEDWQKAIDIFEDRIYGRFLMPIYRIENYEFAGFAIMALDCLLIETLQQFREGEAESSSKSKEYFVRFLTETSFSNCFKTKEIAETFYDQIRCGILHQAETKETSRISIRKSDPLASRDENGEGLVINRKKFHRQLVQEYQTYTSKLRDSSECDLRKTFRKKMNYICRLSQDS